jgi:hypothetical protein
MTVFVVPFYCGKKNPKMFSLLWIFNLDFYFVLEPSSQFFDKADKCLKYQALTSGAYHKAESLAPLRDLLHTAGESGRLKANNRTGSIFLEVLKGQVYAYSNEAEIGGCSISQFSFIFNNFPLESRLSKMHSP